MDTERNNGPETRASVEHETIELWEHLFGDLQGYLVTFTGEQASKRRADARPNELDETKQRSWGYPGQRREAAEYLRTESKNGRDAYFGVHLFEQAGNRLGENAARVLTLWVDGDGAKVPETWPKPTAVIESSPGREHYYWRLSRPIEPEQAARLNKRLCYGMGGDKGKWGLGTVLRAPGTVNYKRDRPSLVGLAGGRNG
jgi:hypothetical protein